MPNNTENKKMGPVNPEEGMEGVERRSTLEYERRATVTIGSEESDEDSVFGDVDNGEEDNKVKRYNYDILLLLNIKLRKL